MERPATWMALSLAIFFLHSLPVLAQDSNPVDVGDLLPVDNNPITQIYSTGVVDPPAADSTDSKTSSQQDVGDLLPIDNNTTTQVYSTGGILDPKDDSKNVTSKDGGSSGLPPALSDSILLTDGPTGDCAEPSRVNLSKSLAEAADIVITGLVVAAGPADVVCAPTNSTLQSLGDKARASSAGGPDLLVDFRTNNSTDNSTNTLLVSVQCVHKGALACSRNSVDIKTSLGRCVVAVKVPPQSNKAGDKLPPCSVTPGYRYTMLLSSKPSAACDGAYAIQHSRIVDSVRPHLPGSSCVPYPAWPSQSSKPDGAGLAGLVAKQCPGAALKTNKPAVCKDDPCKNAKCPSGAAVTCVPKACEGRYMVNSYVTPEEACEPLFFSDYTGLPVSGCGVTAQQLVRQGRQSQRRLGLATGQLTPADLGVGSGGRPRLVDPASLFAGQFGDLAGRLAADAAPDAAANMPPGSTP